MRSAQPTSTTDGHGATEDLARVFSQDRERLRRTILFRMDARMRRRIDVDDVLQESYLAAVRRLDHYRAERCSSMYVWVRMVVLQTMVDLARRLGSVRRGGDVCEVSLHGGPDSGTSLEPWLELCARITSPTRAAARAEAANHLAYVIGNLAPIDREILSMRHFEELSNGEVAAILGLHKAAATNRYLRAMARLHALLEGQRDDLP